MSRSKMTALAFTLLMLTFSSASPQMQFVRSIDIGSDSWTSDVIRTTDGGYVILGGTRSHGAGGNDVLVVKCNDVGGILWTTTIGWDGAESGQAIIEEESGTLLIAAITRSCGAGGSDILLLKMDPDGNVIGAKTLGWTEQEYADDLIPTYGGGYALLGSTNHFGPGNYYDILFIKLNPDADPQWAQTINIDGNSDDLGVALMQTPDLGYAVLAKTTIYPYEDRDVILCKLNLSGGHLWTWKYGGTSEEVPESFIQTTDGGWMIVGHTESYGSGGTDMLMLRVDNFGSHISTKAIGGDYNDEGYQVLQATSAYAVVGNTASYGYGEKDAFLAQFDHLWNATSFWLLGGLDNDLAECCTRATHGGCLKVGRSKNFDTSLVAIKYDTDGETCIGKTFSPIKTTVTPESEEVTPELTYVAPTMLYHTPDVKHPNLQVDTICRDPRCGDADGSGAVDIDDVVYLINFIFDGGPPPDPYVAGDANCSGTVDIDDVVYLISYVFSGGPEPGDPDGDGEPDC